MSASSLVASALVSLFSSNIAPLPGLSLELLAHILCWLLVSLGLRIWSFLEAETLGKRRLRDGINVLQYANVISLGIVAATLCQSLVNINWVLPYMMLALSYLIPLRTQYQKRVLLPEKSNITLRYPVRRQDGIFYLVLFSVAAVYTSLFLIKAPSSTSVLLAFCFFIFTALILLLLHGVGDATKNNHPLLLLLPLKTIANRVLPLLVLIYLFSWQSVPGSTLRTVCATALLRCLYWVLLFMLCRQGHTIALSSINALGVIAAQLLQLQAPLEVADGLLAALAALVQTYLHMPGNKPKRNFSIAFLALVLLIVIRSQFSGKGVNHLSELTESYGHPIELFHQKSEANFMAMVDRQSKTLPEAVIEYTRRYKRAPPPQFDVWFQMARENNFILLDEFDSMMQTLEPFWGLSPQEMRHNLKEALASEENERIMRISIKDHKVDISHDHWMTREILTWLPRFSQYIPDMDLAINALDEPRVVLPHEMLHALLKPRDGSSATSLTGPNFVHAERRSVWDFATLSCPWHDLNPSQDVLSELENSSSLPFIQNMTAATDICQNPQYATRHGFFSSPDHLQVVTNKLAPIFSAAKPSSFQDILYPSPWYSSHYSHATYKKTLDKDWDEKSDSMYWVGSTTGGHGHRGNWHTLHRQRFLHFINGGKSSQIQLLRQETNLETPSSEWMTYNDTMSRAGLSNLFHVKFSNTIHCSWAACLEQEKYFSMEGREDVSRPYESKLVFDIDGNSFSQRFYRLLDSKSTVLKQTAFREWHDDWLVPWVHYVPVNIGMEELAETVRYLLLTDRGRRLNKEIAGDSREWAGKVLRKVDMELFFFRLLLEYGRLLDDDRDALSL